MPEKPEVMTVVKKLDPMIIGRKITGCNIYYNNIISEPSLEEFKKKIIGERINNIKSIGKYIVIDLDKYNLLIHLRMEGKFTFRNIQDEINKHEHVEFILDGDTSWRYHDVRKFGKMYLKDKDKLLNTKPLVNIGKDYYDESLNGDYLYDKIKMKNTYIKNVLLDQSIIAGIGNIYADEILFKSGISPLRRCNKISKNKCDDIVSNTRKVLDSAYKLGGTTIKSFTSSEGVHGLFQNELEVHGKVGEKCPKCGNIIKKIRVGGRGTYYCSNCQK